MCQDFLKSKPLIEELAGCEQFGAQFMVDDEFWEKLEEIVTVLKPAYIATKEMQSIGYGLADFYIAWIHPWSRLGSY